MDENEFLDLIATIRAAEPARNRLLGLVREHFACLARQRLGAGIDAADLSDLVHDALLRVVEDLSGFRGQSLGEFLNWLGLIFKSRLHNAHRYDTRECRDERRNVSLESAPPLFAPDDSPFDLARQAEDAERLAQELARLPQEERLIFHLRFHADLPSSAIAELLQESESNIRTRFQRTVAHLKTILGGDR